MRSSFIIDAVRTPIGSFGGSLSTIRADDLAALPLRRLMDKCPRIPAECIDDVIMGCHNQAGEDNRNVARMALLLAGIPHSVPGETINRLCASGMSAIVHADRAIKAGDAEVVIASGMEHMTRGPWVISKSAKPFGNDAKMFDSSFGWRFVNPKLHQMYGTDAMGVTAENLAEKYQISRYDQDAFAFRSQQNAFRAQQQGILAQEIVGVDLVDKRGQVSIFDRDEFIKGDTSMERLSQLKTVFKTDSGTVTAGNASGLNDGAAAMLICSEQAIASHRLSPVARIVSSAVVGVEPRLMGIGPVGASKKALLKAGLTLNQMSVIELNEAFAAQCLAVMRSLGIDDNDARVNPNGGAIALGHPLGMSGIRIVQAAVNELKRSGGRYALATMCVGVGMGYAIVLENITI